MMKHIFNNHWCRFLAGNLSVGLLVVGIPFLVLLSLTESLSKTTAGLEILAIVHVALVGLQISRTGSWIPEKWLAVGFVSLPVIDVSQTVSLFSRGFWVQGFWAFLLALAAAFVTIHIVQHHWRQWRNPEPPEMPSHPPRREDHPIDHSMDDPTMMVY